MKNNHVITEEDEIKLYWNQLMFLIFNCEQFIVIFGPRIPGRTFTVADNWITYFTFLADVGSTFDFRRHDNTNKYHVFAGGEWGSCYEIRVSYVYSYIRKLRYWATLCFCGKRCTVVNSCWAIHFIYFLSLLVQDLIFGSFINLHSLWTTSSQYLLGGGGGGEIVLWKLCFSIFIKEICDSWPPISSNHVFVGGG